MTETRRDEVERIIREGFADMTHEKATEQDMGASLLPCPFCGGKPEMQFNGPTSEQAQFMTSHGEGWDVSYFVACQCTATGPERSEEIDALTVWNTRTAKPAPEWQGIESAADAPAQVAGDWTSRDLAEALANLDGKPFNGKENEKNRMLFQGQADDLLAELSMIVMLNSPSTPIQDTAK